MNTPLDNGDFDRFGVNESATGPNEADSGIQPSTPETRALLDAINNLAAQVEHGSSRIDKIRQDLERALLPLSNISGLNGISILRSDSNIVISAADLSDAVKEPTAPSDLALPTGPETGTPVTSTDPTNAAPVVTPTTPIGTPVPSVPDFAFTPGDSYTPGAAVAYEGRTRGGTASLIGFSEFTSPSTPAKKYRTLTLSGTVTATAYSNSGCVLTDTGTVFDFEYQWDPQIKSRVILTQSGNTISWTITHVSSYVSTGSYNIRVNGTIIQTYSGSAPVPYGQTQSGSTTLMPGDTFEAINATFTYTRGATFAESLTYAGTSTYDATTGAGPTDAGTVTGNLIDTGTGALAAVSDYALGSVGDASTRLGAGNFTTSVDTALTHSLIHSGSCIQVGSSAYYRKTLTSTLKDTLTLEDTDSDAIARLLAGASWNSWSSTSLPAGSSSYQARTTGFTFDYFHSEVKVNYTGMPSGQAFRAVARVLKVSHVNSTLSSHQVLSYNLVANGSGATSFTLSITPDTPGYTYQLQSITHFL